MSTIKLTDEQWNTFRSIIRKHPHTYLGNETCCRPFVEAVLWVARSGAQWRLLAKAY